MARQQATPLLYLAAFALRLGGWVAGALIAAGDWTDLGTADIHTLANTSSNAPFGTAYPTLLTLVTPSCLISVSQPSAMVSAAAPH